MRGRGTSLGGMRPKCTVIDEDGSLCIAKFPSIADERTVTKGEVLALTLARQAGIDTATARIVQSDDLPVTLIHCFDRQNNGHRVMYLSAATRRHMDRKEASVHIAEWVRSNVAAEEQENFREMAESDLLGLHEGNFARLQVRPSEFAAWQIAWENKKPIFPAQVDRKNPGADSG